MGVCQWCAWGSDPIARGAHGCLSMVRMGVGTCVLPGSSSSDAVATWACQAIRSVVGPAMQSLHVSVKGAHGCLNMCFASDSSARLPAMQWLHEPVKGAHGSVNMCFGSDPIARGAHVSKHMFASDAAVVLQWCTFEYMFGRCCWQLLQHWFSGSVPSCAAMSIEQGTLHQFFLGLPAAPMSPTVPPAGKNGVPHRRSWSQGRRCCRSGRRTRPMTIAMGPGWARRFARQRVGSLMRSQGLGAPARWVPSRRQSAGCPKKVPPPPRRRGRPA